MDQAGHQFATTTMLIYDIDTYGRNNESSAHILLAHVTASDLLVVKLTPFAAAICTMTSMAIRLK